MARMSRSMLMLVLAMDGMKYKEAMAKRMAVTRDAGRRPCRYLVDE